MENIINLKKDFRYAFTIRIKCIVCTKCFKLDIKTKISRFYPSVISKQFFTDFFKITFRVGYVQCNRVLNGGNLSCKIKIFYYEGMYNLAILILLQIVPSLQDIYSMLRR